MKTHIGTFIKIIFMFCLFCFCDRKTIIVENTKNCLIFERFEETGNHDIWLLKIETGEEIKITYTQHYWEEQPLWLNDSEILFLIEPPPASFTERDIVMFNLKTGKKRLLDYWTWRNCPNVGKISIDSFKRIYYRDYEPENGYIINVLNLGDRTPQIKPLIPPGRLKLWGLADVYFPIVSFDGTEVLFSACDTLKYRLMHIEQKKFYYDIYLYLIKKDSLIRLTHGNWNNDYPSWIGRDSIIFSSNRDGNWELYLMDRTGKILNRLTYTDSIDEWQGATASPDHSQICYAGYDWRKDDLEIWLQDLKTGATKYLTKGGNPAWSPAK